MLRWFISAAVLFLLGNVSAFAQGAAVGWYYQPENGTPLTTVCQGGIPIPDGYPIKIMWDANSNGPDISDAPAVLCDVPPLCEYGPSGTSNINTMYFNGQSDIGQAGYFSPYVAFLTVGSLPSPPLFYLRIYEGDGVTPLWTSSVYTLLAGPQEIFIPASNWACGAGGPQCVVLDAQE